MLLMDCIIHRANDVRNYWNVYSTVAWRMVFTHTISSIVVIWNQIKLFDFLYCVNNNNNNSYFPLIFLVFFQKLLSFKIISWVRCSFVSKGTIRSFIRDTPHCVHLSIHKMDEFQAQSNNALICVIPIAITMCLCVPCGHTHCMRSI